MRRLGLGRRLGVIALGAAVALGLGAPIAPAATGGAASALPPPAFAYQRLDIDTAKPVAQACLVFTGKLDPRVHYGEYLVLKPAVKVAIEVKGQRLCLTGLAFGKSYRAELRAGFPGAHGARLAAAHAVDLSLSNRPPLLAFRDGLILPRDNAAGVPITSINVNKIKLTLLRVPARLLSQIPLANFTERQVYGWDVESLKNQQAAVLWHGEMSVAAKPNQSVTTLFPLTEIIKDKKPGVYVLIARNAAQLLPKNGGDEWTHRAIQWVINSDIALTSFKGAGGLDIFARSLATARPLAGINLSLVATNNAVLAKAVTDANGHAHFDPGLLRGTGAVAPRAVMAYGADGDFTFADLTRPAFDLSDRGVGGRALAGPVDAFLYTDRGIYRPRETVEIMALIRDRHAEAITGVPVTLVARRPDGAVYRRVTLMDQGDGAVHEALVLTDTAMHGHWSVDAYLDPKGKSVGHAEFDVEDFIPEQLKVTLSGAPPFLHPGQKVTLGALAWFLYGAPAAGLDGEAEAVVSADPTPFRAYPGFHFGLVQQSFRDKIVPFKVAQTDAKGDTAVTGDLGDLGATTLPLKAQIRVSIFEPGGRSTVTQISVPVRTRPVMLGIHPLFTDDTVPEDTPGQFEIVALDEAGRPVARHGIDWSLVREVTEYTWYKAADGFHFQAATHDEPVAHGTIDLAADKLARLGHVLSWGYYRLTVDDSASGAATSYRFSAGWGGTLSADRPDKAEISPDKKRYHIGDIAHIAIRPPVSGKALVIIANDRILATKLIDVKAGGTIVDMPVTAAWGVGAYAIVAAYRPLTGSNPRTPVRAIGVAWMPIDAAARTLTLKLDLPKQIVPRHKLRIPITVTGSRGTAYVTLAAVDEGILQLTNFASPNPTRYYFGKRRLGVEIRDDYGRLITANGVIGAIRSGGDIGGRALTVVPTKTVALFSGPVKFDAQGKAVITLKIPDFEGDLRFMAVAYDRTKLGEVTQHLIVRDPVVSQVTLPRFLAPGDKSRLALDLHNLDGAPGGYHVAFSASGAVEFGAAASRDVALKKGQRKLETFALDAGKTGIGTIDLALTGPGGFSVARQWQIEVRSPQLPVTRTRIVLVKPGATVHLPPALLDGFLPGTGHLTLSYNSIRTVPLTALLASLDRYPFGCVEQVTSRAYPLLYLNNVAPMAGMSRDVGATARVQDAIDQLLDMQRAAGNFGLWAARGDAAKDWLSVYALDFLTAAAARNYHIPTDAYDRGIAWLRGIVAQSGTEIRTRLYAAYVLARVGAISLPDLRYIFDTDDQAKGINAFAAAQLGAAMAFEGDRARAQTAFAIAEKLPFAKRGSLFGHYDNPDYYGSALRDWAGVMTMAAEAGETGVMAALYRRLEWVNEKPDDLTTQEKAWLLLAMAQITKHEAPVKIVVNGTPMTARDRPVTLNPTATDLAKGYVVQNES
ncbi:MAG: alpha-2-macroglobulin family protein, partial [Stellaceae bacterium]